jgi:peptide/nickel transport system permease protein
MSFAGVQPRLLLSGALLLVLLEGALGADLFSPFSPDQLYVGPLLAPPSAANPMGTDVYGRDQFARLMHGARISIQAGVIVAMGAVVVGLPLGLAAGYRGGWLDDLIGRMLELVFALPWLLVAMILAAIFGPSLNTALASLVIVYGPVVARVTRASVLSERGRDYVTAARVVGGSGVHIVVRHVLPNVLSPLVVLWTSIMSFAVLTEASLSYLGLGAQPPTPSWGRMLTESSTLFASAPHLTLYPGAAVTALVLALNMLGDGLRDHFDPRHLASGQGALERKRTA